MIVWCLISVTIMHGATEVVETAVKGKIISKEEKYYIVDFSEYAKQKGYIGEYDRMYVDNNTCYQESSSK